MKLLVVEDEAKAASFLVKGLTESGFVVDHAAAGEEGLDLALSGSYDLVVLDVLLPKRNGTSVLTELRSQGRATRVVVELPRRRRD